jgi:hypothetical protein
MALQYPPFAASARMHAASNNAPALRYGERSEGVQLLQAGYITLGFKMPRSTKPNGLTDGKFGNETRSVTRDFQKACKLKPDGSPGRNTIGALDRALVGKSSPKPKPGKPIPPPKKPPVIIPAGKYYKIGTGNPPLKHDKGAGPYNSKSAEAAYLAMKYSFIGDPKYQDAARALTGPDALKHLLHYFSNTGRELKINVEGMLSEVPTAKKAFLAEVSQAQAFVEKLPPGTHKITSKKVEGAYCYKGESRNWFFATGGFSYWGKGTATVSGSDCELAFEFHVFDRYNWDGGKKVTILGFEITDEFMGEFHLQGLAMEFNQVGHVKRNLKWNRGGAIPPHQLDAPGWR